MISISSTIIKIDFEQDKGLILKWNFKPNNSTFFFRHVVVLDVGDGFDVQSFVWKYFQRIKLGDMIMLCFMNVENDCSFTLWKEKTPFSEIPYKKIHPHLTSLENIIELLKIVEKNNSDFYEPIILTILTERKDQEFTSLNFYVKNLISHNDSFGANIFGYADTSIDPATGVNIFNLKDFEAQPSWKFLKHFWSQISLSKVKITIECENGSISAQKASQWQMIDFNKITRTMYMPSTLYTHDIIKFLHHDRRDQISYILNLTLQYQELSSRAFVASKKISIKTINQKVYQRTMGFCDFEFAYEIGEGLYSKKNPQKSDSIVWFSKELGNIAQSQV